jgi:D-alanyl-D-alanine carboxypeptidase
VVDGVESVRALLALAGRPVDVTTLEAVANAALFVPLGASLGLAVRPRAWPVALLLAAAPSVGAELAQTRLPGRVPDPQDVLANTVGAVAGLVVAMLVVGAGGIALRLRRRGSVATPRRARGDRRSRLLPVLAGTALALALALVAAVLLHPSPSGRPALPPIPALDPRATALGAQDGYIPDGASVSPFADVPAVARLDPALRRAVQQAARAAEADGVEVVLTSGWRSARYQQRLLDDAVARYGSVQEASRWVSTPSTSRHVEGAAVDIGYTDADDWFLRNGAGWGLCRTYANEMWHFELATEPGGTCPEQLLDASAR